MAISENMIQRGQAVGLTPNDGESSKSFGARVRRGEKAPEKTSATLATPQAAGSGGWRRGGWR